MADPWRDRKVVAPSLRRLWTSSIGGGGSPSPTCLPVAGSLFHGSFWTQFVTLLGPKSDPKIVPKGGPKIDPLLSGGMVDRVPPQGPKMDPKMTPNGSQNGPKTSPNMIQKDSNMRLKMVHFVRSMQQIIRMPGLQCRVYGVLSIESEVQPVQSIEY